MMGLRLWPSELRCKHVVVSGAFVGCMAVIVKVSLLGSVMVTVVVMFGVVVMGVLSGSIIVVIVVHG